MPSKTDIGNIDLPRKEEFDEKGNKKNDTDVKKDPVDKEPEEKGYKIEKRQFPDNDQKVMNRRGMDKSTEIIIRQLRSEGFENTRISEDKQTGRLVIKVPEEVERGRNIFKYIKEKRKFN